MDEDAMTLLIPPLRCGESRHASLDRTGERQCRATNFGESPSCVDSNIHVHTARAAGLWPSSKSHFVEKRFHFKGDSAHIVPVDSGTRVEIDAQLIRMNKVSC